MKIKVNEETRNYIESLQYEVNSNRELMAYMLANNMDISTDSYKLYQNEYLKNYKMFELAKGEMEKTYLSGYMEKDKQYRWNLDYQNCEVTLTEVV